MEKDIKLRKFIATTIREYLSENIDIKKKSFNNDIILISDYEDGVYVITARHNIVGEIARATFEHSNKLGGWYGNDSFVDKRYRRIGIMSAIYDFAEELIGEKLIPSLTLSRNMKKFWDKRNVKSKN